MEGVLVSARRADSTITVTVVSDRRGNYSFPASRLAPGHYSLTIRAVGYELPAAVETDLSAGRTSAVNLKLSKTESLARQLTSAEWIDSAPGTPRLKQHLLNCVGCHTVTRIMQSTHDEAEFLEVFRRMALYCPESTPTHPQPTVGAPYQRINLEQLKPYAAYLASINLSHQATWKFPLRSFPRPRGRATHVIITTYDLPRADAQPHDVIMGRDGMVWYGDFGAEVFGSLDPKTGKTTEYKLPLLKPGLPLGSLDVEPDRAGNIWIAMMYQGGIARFDPRAKALRVFKLPARWQADHTQESMVSPNYAYVNNRVWTNNQDMHALLQLDPDSGNFDNLGSAIDPATHKSVNGYGIPSNHENNVYLLNFGGTVIGLFDAKTRGVAVYSTPTPYSQPRRGHVDAQDRLWFGEYGGNAIGMFDPRTRRITEWPLPTPWSAPYDVVRDNRHGDVWTGSMLTDRVDRLDPRTGHFVEYLLPAKTNIRRVFVDESTNPGTLWIGNNHGASIIKVEPLD